jgi:uncharacterized membrane protein YhaH (DUF805 family)
MVVYLDCLYAGFVGSILALGVRRLHDIGKKGWYFCWDSFSFRIVFSYYHVILHSGPITGTGWIIRCLSPLIKAVKHRKSIAFKYPSVQGGFFGLVS